MKRFAVLGAGMLLLGGCALPVPFQIASWALDGFSYLMTDKSIGDHGLSILSQKDCAVLRGVIGPEEFCRDFDEMATALADGGSYAKILFGNNAEENEEIDAADIAAITEFETAAGGEDSKAEVTHDLAEALPVGIDKEAGRIDLSVAFQNGAELNNYPVEVVATVPALDATPKNISETAVKGWRAQTTRIAGTDNEPVAGYYFVIGSFREHANARKLRNKYRRLTPSVLSAKLDRETVFRVVVGPFVEGQAQGIRKQIYQAGISDSWAIQVNPGEWSMAMVDPPALPPIEVAALDQPFDALEWNALNYLQMLSDLVY
ncbi:MAG: SPOR domain-containing protein [Proteobacteria bacterium]|nr:SPOR domain-containing protein [Pseudomonadota bacterium]